MIIKQHQDGFICIRQHDHGLLSGELAYGLLPQMRSFTNISEDEWLFAVTSHDIGWRSLDRTLLWNEHTNAPYSFEDYPPAPKVQAYTEGINGVEEQDAVAGLLCSLHMTSFFEHDRPLADEEVAFVRAEAARQKRLKGNVNLPEKDLQHAFELLQFCDHLSLYLCLNHPGRKKEEEWPWYKQGFPYRSPALRNHPVVGWWPRTETVIMHPFPFTTPQEVSIPYCFVTREEMTQHNAPYSLKKDSFQQLHTTIQPIK
ncbi:DUF3891 family protein [Aureibacillus halotolerans]|uniref:Uncharacterized protein DUF3891 n=1 Tax=Aureibacillus halotolerans TaxID=1508390 RepID=A0A4R6U4P7_9BACI|nr:DUF3891 family protein [Aureibacillus halotolerans]TDQ41438.1 uncharacterized protein DUF3891 [Aureibacillus halotolerans]